MPEILSCEIVKRSLKEWPNKFAATEFQSPDIFSDHRINGLVKKIKKKIEKKINEKRKNKLIGL